MSTPEEIDEDVAKAIARVIIDHVPVGVMVINEDGEVTLFNHCATDIFGYSQDEALGLDVNTLICEADTPNHSPLLQGAGAVDRPGMTPLPGPRKLHGRHKSGALFPLEFTLSEMRYRRRSLYIGTVRGLAPRADLH